MKADYGVIGGMLLGLGAIARFLWRWEKTFTDTAVDELDRVRKENDDLRKKNNELQIENINLKRGSPNP